jgi:hypothetical protein
MFAPPGFDSFVTSVGMTVVVVIFVGVSLVGYFCIRDAYRFGRIGIPWFFGITLPAVFSVAGYWAAGLSGTVVGIPLLVAFALGRIRANNPRSKAFFRGPMPRK